MTISTNDFENDELSVNRNRAKFLCSIGVDSERTVTARLTHSNKIAVVTPHDKGKIIDSVDALATKSNDVFLTITFSDCLPIFIFDPINRAVALVHAGWRGLAGGILKKCRKHNG